MKHLPGFLKSYKHLFHSAIWGIAFFGFLVNQPLKGQQLIKQLQPRQPELTSIRAIAATANQGWAMIGPIESSDDQKHQFAIRQFGKDHQLLWQQVHKAPSAFHLHDLIQTQDGGMLAVGQLMGGDNPLSNGWLVKMDHEGGVDWQKTIGGDQNEGFHAIRQAKNGRFVVAGWSTSAGQKSDHKGQQYGWLVKLASSGQLIWDKRFGQGNRQGFQSLYLTKNGHYALAGYQGTKDTGTKAWVTRVDTTGERVWDQKLGKGNHARFNQIRQGPDENLVVVGQKSRHQSWFIKLDQTGNTLAKHGYEQPGKHYCQALAKTGEQGWYLAGYQRPLSHPMATKPSYQQGWLMKIDQKGKPQWKRLWGKNSHKGIHALVTLKAEQIIVGGYRSSNKQTPYQEQQAWGLKLGPCKGPVYAKDTVQACNAFTVPSGDETYRTAGTYQDTIAARSGQNAYCDSIITYQVSLSTVNDSVLKKGDTLQAYQKGLDYQWGRMENGFDPISGANGPIFLPDCDGRYALQVSGDCRTLSGPVTVGYPAQDKKPLQAKEYAISPLPAGRSLNITFNTPLQNARIQLKSISGNVIKEKVNQSGVRFRFDTKALFQGLHYLEIHEGGEMIRRKFRKE